MADWTEPIYDRTQEDVEYAKKRIAYFKANDKLLEAQRISERTRFDIEMLRETGFCSGVGAKIFSNARLILLSNMACLIFSSIKRISFLAIFLS